MPQAQSPMNVPVGPRCPGGRSGHRSRRVPGSKCLRSHILSMIEANYRQRNFPSPSGTRISTPPKRRYLLLQVLSFYIEKSRDPLVASEFLRVFWNSISDPLLSSKEIAAAFEERFGPQLLLMSATFTPKLLVDYFHMLNLDHLKITTEQRLEKNCMEKENGFQMASKNLV
ncbi:hypothetical protein AVEN_170720-1 [Araneus ventricosus]|uniref:Uncharacterized protein n=1 Tax=Araneus ventricosus TaxID=182803 RepID=A0A4Y2L5P4_ARAVE|nr:hypothetical protein AVEN_170720-1 [Araneus ventricosus]